ncbi:MAG: DUF4982 domain-containing protein [Clostridia bacterium]|nr:DUF4982 domain-containing protein [Clostridia bacterium]
MRRTDFNTGWRYSDNNGKTWEDVTLPHDAMLYSKRSAESAGGRDVGFFEGGVYVYEKCFDVPVSFKEKSVYVEFGGIYRNAAVYCNGKKLAFQPYGYTSFAVSLDGALKYGETNVLRVEADNSKLPDSRWYAGGGIYQSVSLYTGGRDHINIYGVKINTVSYDPPKIEINTDFTGSGAVFVEILDENTVIASAAGQKVSFILPDAVLWSEDTPKLYTCRVTLDNGGAVCDTAEEHFGIRKIEWSGKGLFINGRRTLLRGACIHSDNGVIGARSIYEAEERRIRKLKEFGFNAVRSAHNPASRELTEACDRLGVYVIDEAFDTWYEHKLLYDYASCFDGWYEKDLTAMALKDYDHPCVIMYSIGNEVCEPRDKKGLDTAKKMIDILHGTDPYRPVTAGINLSLFYMTSKGIGVFKVKRSSKKAKASGSLFFNMVMQALGSGMNDFPRLNTVDKVTSPLLDMLDIAGYNYASGRYPLDGKKHPERIILGTETLPQMISKNWDMVEKYPYLTGDFMWTGWDYLGECAVGAWTYDGTKTSNVSYPWLLSCAGAFDITGYPGAEAYYAKTVFTKSITPYIGVRPCNNKNKVIKAIWRGTDATDSWSWRGCCGNKVTVEVYSCAYSAKLYVNGKAVGQKKIKNKKAVFKTVYRPGTVTAAVFDKDGKELGRHSLKSAGDDTEIYITEEDNAYVGKPLYLNVCIADGYGTVESNADRMLYIEAENAKILGFGSADPAPYDPFVYKKAKTHLGRALAVIRPVSAGDVRIKITDEYGNEAEKVLKATEKI